MHKRSYKHVLYISYNTRQHKTVLWNLHLLTLKALFESVWFYVVIHQGGVIARLVRLQKEFSIRQAMYV